MDALQPLQAPPAASLAPAHAGRSVGLPACRSLSSNALLCVVLFLERAAGDGSACLLSPAFLTARRHGLLPLPTVLGTEQAVDRDV